MRGTKHETRMLELGRGAKVINNLMDVVFLGLIVWSMNSGIEGVPPGVGLCSVIAACVLVRVGHIARMLEQRPR